MNVYIFECRMCRKLTLLHLAQCHDCGARNEYQDVTVKIDRVLEQKALKGLDLISHDVEDIMIEEANEMNQSA